MCVCVCVCVCVCLSVCVSVSGMGGHQESEQGGTHSFVGECETGEVLNGTAFILVDTMPKCKTEALRESVLSSALLESWRRTRKQAACRTGRPLL